MTVEILEKPNELDDIADQWRALHPPLHAPYLTYDWFRACAEATSPPARLAIVVLRSGDDIRAIAPLVLQRRRSTRLPFLEILGNPLCELFEPTDFFYADTDSLKELLYAIMAMGHPLRLERIPNISPTAAAARDIPGVWRLWDWRKTYAPVLPLSTDSNDLSAIWPKHRKRSVKRAWKKAERFGDVSFELVTPEPSTIARHFQEFLAVEDASWKGRAGSALAKNVHAQRFWKSYIETLTCLGLARVSTLRVNGRAVAVQLGAEYNRRYWGLKIGHDESFDKMSPGLLLTHHTLRHAVDRGLEAYEFMGVATPWKLRWATTTHEYSSFRLYPRSLPSRTSYFADRGWVAAQILRTATSNAIGQ